MTPIPPDAALEFWKENERQTQEELEFYVSVIRDIIYHASPIAEDDDGFVAVGYTVTIGAIHRAIAALQGARS